MSKRKRIGRLALCLIVSFVMVMTLIPRMPAGLAYAAAGDVPNHSKTLDNNEDGTFKLELSVTGDADNETQEAGDVDLVVVYDVSSSMNTQDVRVGNRNYTRADQAEDAVHDFLANLATYRNDAGTNIRVSLVNFAVTGDQIQGWTNNVTGLANRFDDGGTDGTVSFAYTGSSHNGTNWESALQRAQTLVNSSREGVPTFVILITDGAPTASGNGSNAVSPTGASIATLRDRYNAATNEAESIATAVSAKDGTFYGIFAYSQEADLLDDLMYYSVNGQHRGNNINNVVAATQEPHPNYFNAGNTDDLNAAITEIFDKIVQAMGISAVSISDGTTHEVRTSTGEMSELLEVIEDYQYWISIPVINNQFQRVDRDGNTVTYTVTDNGSGSCTVTWGSNSVTVDGSVSSGQFKYEWKEANALYNYDPPAAVFRNSAVDWNLSSVGTLLDGVTYSVTFDVYPSQETLDDIADIKNDPGADGAWGDLDPVIQQYLDVNGNLKTNTTATLSYTDTRTGQSGSTQYDNPDPVETSAVEQLAITKAWNNELEDEWDKPAQIVLDVTRDGVNTYTATLKEDTDPEKSWKDNVFISIGIMRTSGSDIELLTTGHNFTFSEPGAASGYKWELDVPVVRPMKIDGTDTILVLVDEAHPAPNGATTYTLPDKDGVKGGTYYVDNELASLTATNERRSSLNILKAVDGEDAPEDAEFPFTLNIVNSLAPDTAPSETEDPNHDSDWWVWISVRDMSETDDPEQAPPVTDAVVSGATHAGGGWYYGVSGRDIVLNVKDGYSIRLNNLPVDSEYTITEGELTTGFVFEGAEIEIVDGIGTETDSFAVDKNAKKASGKIQETNTLYQVTMNNKYELTDVEVTKSWVDEDNQDGIRPDNLELTLNGLPAGTTAPDPEIVKNGNTWTYTWKGLPRFDANNEEITYTVSEETVPEGYECNGSPANDHGTITNTHEPEVTEATVIKVWDDSNNQDGKRPASLEVTLSNGQTVTLNEGNSWTATIPNLPKYSNGNEIEYTWTEGSMPAGYSLFNTSKNGTVTTLTNRYVPQTTTVNAEKIWKSGSTTLAEAPEAITLHLNKQVGSGAPAVVTGQDKTIPKGASGDDLKVSWTNLPVYEGGQPITYTVTEDTLAGYTTTITGNAADGFVITNSNVTVASELLSKTVTAANPAKDSTFAFSAVEVTDETGETEKEGGWSGTGEITFAKGESNSKTVTFGDEPISYGEAGVHYYKITETTVPAGWTATYPDGKTFAIAKVTVSYDETTGELSATVEKANISNAYSVQPTTITLGASKTLVVQSGDNAPDVSEKYDLILKAGETTIDSQKNPDGDGTAVDFSEITYTAAGTYTYTVSESCNVEGGKIAGVTDDAQASGKTVVVTVTDNGDGTLSAEVTSGSQVTGFTNTYNVSPTSIDLKASKKLNTDGNANNPPDVSGAYDLTLTAKDDAPMPEGATDGTIKKQNPDGNATAVSFGTINYTAPGTFNYTVTESGTVAGVENGTASYDVTVTVTDGGDGTLSAEVTSGSQVTNFINTYKVDPVKVELEAAKVLEGKNLKPDDFNFVLKKADGTTVETVPNGEGGAVEFTEIEYTKPGEYTYTINEVIPDNQDSHITYDRTTKNVVVKVTDNGAGKLVAEVKYDGSADVPVFTNKYTPDPTEANISVLKALTGRDLNAGEFTFTLDLTGFVPAESTADPGTDNSATDDTTSDVPSNEASGEDPEAKAPAADNAVPEAETPETETPENEAEVPSEESTAPDEISTESDATVDGMSFTGTASIELIPTSVNNAESAKAGTMAVPGVKAKVPASQKHLEAVNDANGNVNFEAIEYDQAGTYTYTIKEVKGELGGVTYSTETIVVTVEVTYNEDTGEYTAEVKYPEDKTFNNTYAPKPTSAAFEAKKVLTGRPLKADDFEFTLTGSGDVSQTKTNAADGSVKFDSISYDKAGTYTYTIKETKGSLGGVTYDEHEVTVTVVVTDDLEGQLHAAVSYSETVTLDDGSTNKITLEEGEVPTFTNTYEPAPVKEKIEVSKALTGRAQEEGEFSFSLVEVKGEETVLVDTATNTAEGKVTFKEIEYTEVGEHTYKVSENIPTETKGITYDTSVFEIKVKITDDLEGNLVAQVIYPNDKEFNNTYEASGSFNPEVTKILEGKDLEDGEFKFTITGPEGKLPASTTITNDAQGIAKFGAITCDETNIGDVYEYTITEVNSGERFVTYDDKVVTLKVTVVDNKDGTLSFTKEYTPSTPVFNNTFKIIYGDLKINKTVDVYDDVNTTSFVFGITAMLDGVKVYDDVVSLDFDEAGTLSAEIIGKIPVGSVVTVKEIFASGSYELTSDEPEAVIIVENETAEVNFTNTYNNKLIQGYGILNEYTNDGTGWNHKSN